MLRQVIGRHLVRQSTVKPFAQGLVWARAQSQAAPVQGQTQTQPPTIQAGDAAAKKPEEFKGQKKTVGKPRDSKARARRNYNQKVSEITQQIRRAADSASADLTEPIQILEEGLSYLREIQKAEGISEEELYRSFQVVILTIFRKAQADGANLGGKSVEDIFDMLVQYQVAHGYHFATMMARKLQSDSADYDGVLTLWVRYLEYSKLQPNQFQFFKCYHSKLNGIPGVSYYQNDLPNVVFFAYMQSLIQQEIKFDAEIASKVLQQEELPSLFQVGSTVVRLGILSSQEEFGKSFGDAIDQFNVESTDPNGPIVLKRINQYVERRYTMGVKKTYDQIIEAASRKGGIKIQEITLIRFMAAYIQLGEYDLCLDVFSNMVSHGVQQPSAHSWEMMLFALCNPQRVKSMEKNGRKLDMLARKLEQCIATMEANKLQFNAKMLSVVIGCYANLNLMDKVDQLMQGERLLGGKKLPIIQKGKNNYILGLIANGSVANAENKLQQFQAEDVSYIPSINVLNSFLKKYVDGKNFESAEKVLKYAKDNHVEYDLATYTILIDMHFKINREMGQSAKIETIFQLLSEATTNKDGTPSSIKLNEITLGSIIDGLCKDGSNIDAARTLYKYVSKNMKPTRESTTAMLSTELEFGSLDEAKKLFQMYTSNITNSSRIWNMMIKGLLKRDEEMALEFFHDFKKKSNAQCKPNFFTYYFLLEYFLRKDRREIVQALVDDINGGALTDLGDTLPKVLNSIKGQYEVRHDLVN
ncbi:putative mitochondrial group I intron splicing factor CCM1 [[Candida] railenensis]|uniref:Mitochondrial 15S rRNA processing factor CCM1 n=1 Tax=[Candida] railenensis TaxID=45579 RepID=A0A9P0QLZ6_9ASCO|nr:putative mitochondrial group I intron splicing factor CCM1 [[Candida] railenensis]